jgi:hypothetical protein
MPLPRYVKYGTAADLEMCLVQLPRRWYSHGPTNAITAATINIAAIKTACITPSRRKWELMLNFRDGSDMRSNDIWMSKMQLISRHTGHKSERRDATLCRSC